MTTFLVTGANTGIGKATAMALASEGGRIHLACRSEAKTREAMAEITARTGNTDLHYLPLDLGDLASVRACAERFLSGDDRLDVLINNAGVAGQRGMTTDGFELTFGINHVGHFLLTTLLLERLEASTPARVVTVSSVAHFQAKTIDFDAVRQPTSLTGIPEYAVSKLANVVFSQELARRTEGTGITTYSLHPGAIASDIWGRRLPGPLAAVMKLFMRSPEDGARTSVWCATAPELASESGRYYDDCREKAPNRAATPELGAELWRRSTEWTAPG